MNDLTNERVEEDHVGCDRTANRLYRELLAFEFDEPGTELTFPVRLARDNGWSARFAERVIGEYKKFVFLAVVAGHPVCPSEEVDEAWHLHLTWTRSYWHNLCPLLGRPLHHRPTKGGSAELRKHVEMYEQTRDSYRRLFGYDPPADIWPAAAERFCLGRGHRRVDLNTHWVIPKPRLQKAGTFFMAAGAAGPAAGVVANPFNFDGPTFLILYAILFPLALAAAFILRRMLRGSGFTPIDDSIAPYEAAYLAGRRPLAIRSAMASLVDQRVLAVREVKKKLLGVVPVAAEYRLVQKGELSDDASALEKAIYEAAVGEGQTIPKLHEAADSPAAALGQGLSERGWRWTRTNRQRHAIGRPCCWRVWRRWA